ncbi:MAG TPA: hypothetical protein VGK90_03090 [Rhizomicrobium sp.]|jgi:hypothetical protein
MERGSLERLLSEGWGYHDKESERLARELETVAESGVTSAFLVPFLQLSTHVIGEHLGDWARALELGRRVLDGQTPTIETARAWGRLYVAAILAGDAIGAAELELCCLKASGDDLGAALLDMRFMLVAALVGSRRAGDASRLYRGALDLVGQIPQSPLLERTIAIAGNNLGWELYEMSARSDDEDELMRLCAATSLKFWLRGGNWINVERAHYLNARVANVSGDPTSGLAHAGAGLEIIAANGERPTRPARINA